MKGRLAKRSNGAFNTAYEKELEEHSALCREIHRVAHQRCRRRGTGHPPMRTVTLIIVHCSANQAGSAFRMADIDRYHRSLGWIGCGYHYVIPTDGTVEPGRPEEMTGAHCKGHNRHSIGVCYIGGLSSKGGSAQSLSLLRCGQRISGLESVINYYRSYRS